MTGKIAIPRRIRSTSIELVIETCEMFAPVDIVVTREDITHYDRVKGEKLPVRYEVFLNYAVTPEVLPNRHISHPEHLVDLGYDLKTAKLCKEMNVMILRVDNSHVLGEVNPQIAARLQTIIEMGDSAVKSLIYKFNEQEHNILENGTDFLIEGKHPEKRYKITDPAPFTS